MIRYHKNGFGRDSQNLTTSKQTTAPADGHLHCCFPDVDECRDSGVCRGGQCLNTDGSFRCQCPPGFDVSADQLHCIGETSLN